MTFSADCAVLLERIGRLYRSSAHDGAAYGLRTAANVLASAPAAVTPDAKTLPVCRNLPATLQSARRGSLLDIAEAFAVLADRCTWTQNPNYVARPPSVDFLDGYGYVELVGPGRPVPAPDFRVGFLILGPGIEYPAHAHPAEEVYHVIGGRAHWWRDGEDWRTKDPGAAIHHAPNVVHATRTTGEPLLALYCWFGDIAAHARFV
jgi:quercetin dioxygenase-like cupin family protein